MLPFPYSCYCAAELADALTRGRAHLWQLFWPEYDQGDDQDDHQLPQMPREHMSIYLRTMMMAAMKGWIAQI